MTDEKPISIREFGRIHGLTDTSIQNYIKKGYILNENIPINSKNGRPGIIRSGAEKNLSENFKKDWSKAGIVYDEKTVSTDTKNNTKKDTSVKSEDNDFDIIVSNTDNLVDVRKKLEQVKLKSTLLDLKKKQGDLIPRAEVYKSLYEKADEIKLAFQAIPAQTIDNIMAARTRNEAMLILSEKIDEVLIKLSNTDAVKLETKRRK
jgi:hypothetical protein